MTVAEHVDGSTQAPVIHLVEFVQGEKLIVVPGWRPVETRA
ncbi:hypothetical protein [Vannielia litorea]|nr:hypothetical protein [Vannielia litorea]